MTPQLRNKYTFGALASFTLIGSLAGCAAADTAADSNTGTDTTDTTESSTDSGTDTGSSSGESVYADGDYTAEGSYSSPGGTETIEVELSLEGDIVTAVTVTGDASNANAERYQTEFEDGIAAEVVGENIDDLDVDRVAGSSLTSGGFNEAVESIKADALG
jgi:uncharacterized protein with FMN-binding domain